MKSYGMESVGRVLKGAEEEVDRYDAILGYLGGHHRIDEIALLVTDTAQLDMLDGLLQNEFGWERFNKANDSVRTAPIRSGYTVEYTFYRCQEVPWRLEVMRLTSGISPLHSAIPLPLMAQVCTPVHASFKCADEESYAVARYELDDRGWFLAQQCDSTYGRFSYYTKIGSAPSRVPYLKPRANLRDG